MLSLIHTSVTDPIRVNWLPLPGPGAVGLTFAPGKQGASPVRAVVHWRNLDADLERLRQVEEVDVLVCLLEQHELHRLAIPDYELRAKRHHLEVLRLPIPDGGVPRSAKDVMGLLAKIRQRVTRGKRVAIHCAGGLGRAGTIGGCYLCAAGFTSAEALEVLRRARGPRCPEMPMQIEYVRRWPHVAVVEPSRPLRRRRR
jgi:protein-tyrosine phosphatase